MSTLALRQPVPLGRFAAYVVLAFGLFAVAWQLANAPPANLARIAGTDLHIYQDAARSWLAGTGFYLPHQLAGPFTVDLGDVLYPPPWLLLFVPFTVIPWPIWWAVPLSITAAVIAYWRPTPLGWATIGLFLAWPPTVSSLLSGNPNMWLVAVLALATRWPWVSVLLLAKPTVAPLALFGIRNRRWWLALFPMAALSALFLPMWTDYVRVALNAHSLAGPFYSAQVLPLYCIPLIAWATSGRVAERVRDGRRGATST